MHTRSGVMGGLPAGHREQLAALARQRFFPMGARIFEEDGPADRFWTVHSGTVSLDLRVPGRRLPVVMESLGPGELLGWSALVPPHQWHMGAEAASPVRAEEFDIEAVRRLCAADPELDLALCHYVSRVVAHRLRASRNRLLDLMAAHGIL
ncbi:cyclic nucleotide-binding domain-containing protein [Streptomyces sp. JJ36]|uniref:cyclic nucleotide-binding domain-containing protein n=1 Tax=Streptomyces sp. JJ36 TaxID=2736645 RepID=UPI001F41E16D|nr:cyclic nucleotide-binding domain-containing protein [Streptomyces sp. JJ36]MCF6524860.1 cyclic nucleotide-binding domain-containing protein [Streptomyces sp. JJ36]